MESGGVANGTTVQSGGLQSVLSGGTARNTTVLAGGTLQLNASGASDATVTGTIQSGSLQNGTQVPGTVVIATGSHKAIISAVIAGTANIDVIGKGLLSGANTCACFTTVETGGKLTLTGAGTLGGQGSEADVSGTLDLGTTTQTLDNFSLQAGGTVKNGTMSSSGVFDLQGGTVSAGDGSPLVM